MGVCRAKGKDKAEIAAKNAVSSPLLETSIDGATGVIINITASPDIGLDEVDTASQMIANAAHPDANIIWGAAFDDSLEDEMIITVVATGFGLDENGELKAPKKPLVETKSEEKSEEKGFGFDSDDDIFSVPGAGKKQDNKTDEFLDMMDLWGNK